ncbi:MAG TPA: MBL fold metallo-hydrolase [Polyangiaceae bacterium]|jgi:L-ascorbate metabolism protein UlaG (beta-lactamase superfamily)|nr:MBL fold metallo-hydrolase [Polyangiaceae bacterium]
MRLEALGHASFVVRAANATLCFDPLLFDPHHEGLYEVYPPRSIDLGELPKLDALIISHGHADHMDPDSLAFFPRELPVITVDDPLVIGCLEGLGFENVIVAQNLVPIEIGEAKLVPTPAAPGAREHGFIVQDEQRTLWHLVDTIPDPGSIAAVLEQYPAIDVLIAPWQPLQDAALSAGEPLVFPFEMYGRLLANIAQIAPKILVPGACGFRAVGAPAFTNHLIFPVTRARFLEDIARVVPKLREATLVLEPGDSFTFQSGLTSVESGILPYCRSDRQAYDWQELAFRPFELGFPTRETRGAAFSRAECFDAVALFMQQTLLETIQEQRQYFAWHHKWQVVRQYEVVFAQNEREYWTLDFRSNPPSVTHGPSALALAHTVLPASLLIGLVAGTISWDYAILSAELRRHDHSYLASENGLQRPTPGLVFEPLTILFGTREAAEFALAEQLERVHREWEQAEAEYAATQASNEVMFTSRKILDPATVLVDVLEQLGGPKPSERSTLGTEEY